MTDVARKRRILFCVNASWNVINFRTGLLRRLMAEGYAITVAAPSDAYSARIEAMGCRYVVLPMAPHGRSPIADLALLLRLRRLIRRERPDVFLGYTVKPNIYGALAASAAGVPTICNVAGLGQVFEKSDWTARILLRLYRTAFSRVTHVFFQNEDDHARFIAGGVVDAERSEVLPGSGVDLDHFADMPPPPYFKGKASFLFVGRLLRAKGVGELARAARQLRVRWPGIEVRLLGFPGEAPTFVTRHEIGDWSKAGGLIHLGASDDVRPHLAAADCVVLPSYYPEGTPRALLEAAASGRPIITTDMPGCRRVVDNGINGFLVPPCDVDALADAMRHFTMLDQKARCAMGNASREKACNEFDEDIVCNRYVAILDRATAKIT